MSYIDVVVCDDNELFCKMVKDTIEKTNDMRLVGIANNGLDAVEVIKSTLPDLVLLDNVLPKLDGLGVLEILNKTELLKRPKIIAISSFYSDDYVMATFKLGANYCMSRDISISQMLTRGRMLLNMYDATPPQVDNADAKAVDFEQSVKALLHKLGIPANLKGFEYLRKAIMIAVDDPSALNGVTKIIYPTIASEYKTDSCNVERAIRHAIKISWERSAPEVFTQLFAPIMDKKKARPTNSEVIATLSQYASTL